MKFDILRNYDSFTIFGLRVLWDRPGGSIQIFQVSFVAGCSYCSWFLCLYQWTLSSAAEPLDSGVGVHSILVRPRQILFLPQLDSYEKKWLTLSMLDRCKSDLGPMLLGTTLAQCFQTRHFGIFDAATEPFNMEDNHGARPM